MTDHEKVAKECWRLRRQVGVVQGQVRHWKKMWQRERARRVWLERRVEELEGRGRATACNSSLPPSANPVGARKPVTKKPTGRRPGGQPGHRGQARKLLPRDKVNHVIEHRAEVCSHCQAAIAAGTPGEVVGRHQVAELPPVAVVITEHQSIACRCGRCGKVNRGRIAPELLGSVTGPRLSAVMAILSAGMKGSKRDVRRVIAELLGCELSLGTVSAREKELSEALSGQYQQLVKQAAEMPVKYVDETSWKLKGKSQWLFVAAGEDLVVYRAERNRTRQGLEALLGGELGTGIFCTDRFGIYDLLPVKRRQLCWAHLKRDFVAAVERGGAGEAIGWKLLEIEREVFEKWHRFKGGQCAPRQWKKAVRELRRRMRAVLEEGAGCGQKKSAGLCRGLLKRERALWRFALTEGVEPTNNLAERMLRPAVIWRKKCFGNSSQAGCRYVERMLSVMQTLRQRGRPVLEYLAETIAAHRAGRQGPEMPGRLPEEAEGAHEDGAGPKRLQEAA